MDAKPIRTVIETEYDKLIQARIDTVNLLEKIDKQLAKLRGTLKGKY